MDIHELLTKVKGEETHYTPCNMPLSLFERFDAIAVQEQTSRSKLLVVATQLLVQVYDGTDGGQEVAEGGDEVRELE